LTGGAGSRPAGPSPTPRPRGSRVAGRAPVDWSPVTPTAPGAGPRPTGTAPLPLTALADLVGAPIGLPPGGPPSIRGVTLASPEVQPGDLYARSEERRVGKEARLRRCRR